MPQNTEEQFPLRLEGVSVHYIHGNRLQPVPDMLTKLPYDEALALVCTCYTIVRKLYHGLALWY